MKRYLATLLFSLALSPVAADARSLHWETLEVTARLDAEGHLHVRESQTMVFTGSWNGGERTFRIGGEQEIDLHGLVRVDPAGGAAIRLRPGSLGNVDHYVWHRRSLRPSKNSLSMATWAAAATGLAAGVASPSSSSGGGGGGGGGSSGGGGGGGW